MTVGTFRFEIGEFECVSVSDGALNYPPESFFSNTPLERVEEALRERNLPTAQVMTPYTCLFVDTSEHRVLIDVGAGDLGVHAARMFPGPDLSGRTLLFSASLRDETDLDTLNYELVSVVRKTIQPSHVSLWLRPDTPVKGEQEVQQFYSPHCLKLALDCNECGQPLASASLPLLLGKLGEASG